MFPISGSISCQNKFNAKKIGLFESFDPDDLEKLLPVIELILMKSGFLCHFNT